MKKKLFLVALVAIMLIGLLVSGNDEAGDYARDQAILKAQENLAVMTWAIHGREPTDRELQETSRAALKALE